MLKVIGLFRTPHIHHRGHGGNVICRHRAWTCITRYCAHPSVTKTFSRVTCSGKMSQLGNDILAQTRERRDNTCLPTFLLHTFLRRLFAWNACPSFGPQSNTNYVSWILGIEIIPPFSIQVPMKFRSIHFDSIFYHYNYSKPAYIDSAGTNSDK